MPKYVDADALLEQMKLRRFFVGRSSDPICIIEDAPAADVESVVRCRDCRYKAYVKPEYLPWKPLYPFITPGGYEIEFPDEENNPCPFLDGDPYGSEMPPDNFYCAHGARKGGEKDDA